MNTSLHSDELNSEHSLASSCACQISRLALILKHATFVAISCGVVNVSSAQTVTLRVLMPHEGPVIPAARPALHNGVFSAYGVQLSPSRDGIYMGELSVVPPPNGVPVTFIASNNTVMPNNPTRLFGRFGQPTVWNGVSYFSGGASHVINDGVYAGRPDGSPLTVAADRLAGEPWIDFSVAGRAGLAYIHAGINVGTGAGMSLFTYDHFRIPIVDYNQAMPGGGQMQSTNINTGDGWISQGGETVAYSVLCNSPNGSNSGVYAWDTASGNTSLIANWNTPIPGDGRLMLHATGVDTDGQRVSFVGANGNPYFGGVHAICVANIETGALISIARTGQPVVGVPGATWKRFLHTAIDGALVYFQASYFSGSSEVFGMFAHDSTTATTFAVMIPGQVIGGHAILAAWFVPEGIDGPDSVAQCEFITPDSPMLSKKMLVYARIDRPCRADFNSDGSLDFFDYLDFVGEFAIGSVAADFNNDGVTDFFDYLDFVQLFSEGC